MILFTSATEEQRKRVRRTSFVYLWITLFCVLFGTVYEQFSHGIYSGFMLYAFAFPLVGGLLPFALLARQANGWFPGRLALHLHHCGIATLTVGSIVCGVLEIYGTENDWTQLYWIVGFGLVLAGIVVYVFELLGSPGSSTAAGGE